MLLPFPHISLLRNVLAYVSHVNTDPLVPAEFGIRKPVTFKGTIKLHGANCGVIWTPDGNLQAQSREALLTPEADYKGFAKFTLEHAEQIRDIVTFLVLPRLELTGTVHKVALYGEWVGAGVVAKAKGAAVAKFDPKHWALFAVGAVLGDDPQTQNVSPTLATPSYSLPFTRIGNVHSVGLDLTLTIDFNDPASVEAGEALAKRFTDEVTEQCPYGAAYGLTGAGEGIVWMPVGEFHGREDLYWKHKSEAHAVVDTPIVRERPSIEAAVQTRIDAFVVTVVTANRLEQGLDALEQQGLGIEKRNTGKFIQWLSADVARECALELTEAGLQWSQVAALVTTKAREFFLAATEQGSK